MKNKRRTGAREDRLIDSWDGEGGGDVVRGRDEPRASGSCGT